MHSRPFMPPTRDPDRFPFRLLCVDDDPYISDGLARCLSDYGIQVLRAYNGMQGFWRVLRDKPDGLISDLSMPNGNGIEMMECLRGNAATEFLPIIVLTGTDNAGLRRRLRRLKVSAVLEKPASAEEILLELFLTDFFADRPQCSRLNVAAATDYSEHSTFADCSSSLFPSN